MKKFAITGLLSAAMMTTVATAGVFSDVEPSHWAYKTLNTLHAQGIVKGDGTGKFKGGERITRYEAAMMVGEAIRYVSSVRAAGGTIDHETMDMISSIMTEMTDEMQVLEIRVEENSDAIAAMRKDLTMKGKSCQGATIPMGAGRLKIMGQAMFSLVAGGDNSAYSEDIRTTNAGAVAPFTTEGVNEFLVDYATLGFAADIDEKTSFYTRANIYMGGHAGTQVTITDSTGNPLQADGLHMLGEIGTSGIAFDDFMYIHVKDLWEGWDMSLGRIGTPWGHETAGMFRTNPYFVSNSMVDAFYSGLLDGAYFSSENKDGDWYYGFGLHNGALLATPEMNLSHTYSFKSAFAAGINAGGIFIPDPSQITAKQNIQNAVAGWNGRFANVGVNQNGDDEFGYLLHIGSQAQNGDLKWDLSYFTNNASLEYNTTAANYAGFGEMTFFNLGVDYRIDKDWHITAEYVDGTVETATAIAANPVAEDDFTTWYAQLIYNLDSKSTLALRYGVHEYDAEAITGRGILGKDEVNELTFAYARKLSDNGTMIIEYSQPDVDKANGAAIAGGNDDFDVIRASYRIDF